MDMTKYPMHERFAAVATDAAVVQNFLDSMRYPEDELPEKSLVGLVFEHHEENSFGKSEYTLLTDAVCEGLMARFFGIDLRAFYAEKEQMLADIRAAQGL